jgi:hypothetical protein
MNETQNYLSYWNGKTIVKTVFWCENILYFSVLSLPVWRKAVDLWSEWNKHWEKTYFVGDRWIFIDKNKCPVIFILKPQMNIMSSWRSEVVSKCQMKKR